MKPFSLEHIIRNIAQGNFTPSDQPKITLEHTIREVHESVGTLGTDKFQGSQFRTAKTVAPVIKPGHNERSETAANARNTAKTDKSLTLHGKVSESAPSDMSGVTAATQCPSESGKKKSIKETPAPNYGNAASVGSWPAAEAGKKKIKEEAEASGTIARRKVKDVPRPDDADPKSEKSKLSRLAQIKTKIVDEEKIVAGKTPVILDPVLKQVTPEGDMKAANKRYKKIVKEAIAEAKLPVSGIAGSGLGVMDKLSTAYNQAKSGEYKKALSTAGTAAVQGALTYTPGLGTALQVMAPTPAGAATSEFERQKKLGVTPKPASSDSSSLKKDKSSFGPDTSGFK